MSIFLKLKDLDRRWIFLCVALAVILPMVFKFDLPVYPSKAVLGIYNAIDKLPENSRVFISIDYDPAAEPELSPAATAVFVHLFRRNIKTIVGGNWPTALDIAEKCLSDAKNIYTNTYDEYQKAGKLAKGAKKNLVYGEDYVNLGYKPGGVIHVKNLCANFLGPYPQDGRGTSTDVMGIFKNADGSKFSMKNIDLIVSYTAGTNGIEAFISVEGDHKRQMACGCTSVNIPRFTTYMQTGQLVGMIGGLPGAAEYEALIGYRGEGRAGMAPQSISHLIIMIFIILGNLAYIAEKRLTAKKKA